MGILYLRSLADGVARVERDARLWVVVPSEAEFRLALRLGLEANCLQRMLLTTDADLWDLDRPLSDAFRMISDGQWRPCHVGALETREVVA